MTGARSVAPWKGVRSVPSPAKAEELSDGGVALEVISLCQPQKSQCLRTSRSSGPRVCRYGKQQARPRAAMQIFEEVKEAKQVSVRGAGLTDCNGVDPTLRNCKNSSAQRRAREHVCTAPLCGGLLYGTCSTAPSSVRHGLLPCRN